MKNFLIFMSSALLLLSCQNDDGPDPPNMDGPGWLKDQTIDISGTIRNYHLYIPENSTNSPMVFLLHGNRSNYDEIMGFTGVKAPYKAWESVAEQANLILVIPNGTDGPTGHRGWNDCRSNATGNPDSDDVLFVGGLIDFVLNEYQANASKVFAVGTSNGGHMAIRLAQEIPNKIKAFASIAASNPLNSQCTNSAVPISALIMNGTEDPILPYGGGPMAGNRGEVLSAQETIDYWVNRNQTETTPAVIDLPDTDPDDNSTVRKYLYQNGTSNSEVVLYEVIGGGHTEPSILQRYSDAFKIIVKEQNGDIEMANEVWDFFKTK